MDDQPEKYRVAAGLLNVRSGPSTRDAVLGQVKKDEVIEAIEESEDGRWVMTTLRGTGSAAQSRQGWVSRKYLKKIPRVPGPDEDFEWMKIAEKEKGIIEIPGEASHPRVIQYLALTDLRSRARTRDETNWCSAFVNWCVSQAGYEGTGSALARSWMKWGVKIEAPRRGCIVVFSRGRGFGHVGFFLGETESDILVLGGNQENPFTHLSEVSERYYPKTRLLGYRIPG